MSDLVATIADDINAGTLISSFTDLVPYIKIIVPVSLGIHFLRKLIKGTGKGKVDM